MSLSLLLSGKYSTFLYLISINLSPILQYINFPLSFIININILHLFIHIHPINNQWFRRHHSIHIHPPLLHILLRIYSHHFLLRIIIFSNCIYSLLYISLSAILFMVIFGNDCYLWTGVRRYQMWCVMRNCLVERMPLCVLLIDSWRIRSSLIML